MVALATRGGCSFDSKGARAAAAGATGLLLADDRGGDPNAVPIRLGVPGGTISDLDGSRIRQALAGAAAAERSASRPIASRWAHRGRACRRASRPVGLTAFQHRLKPDVSAVGAQVISSTMTEFAGDQYAILDGTSFSAPHIAGGAALLLERHPSWTPKQVKSALMSTAGPAWANSNRTVEASIAIEGAGLANLPAADTPFLFTDPQSLSFGDLNISAGGSSKTLLVALSDAGGGAGTWQVEVQTPDVQRRCFSIRTTGGHARARRPDDAPDRGHCLGKRDCCRRVRLRRAASRRRGQAVAVRVLRRPAAARERTGDNAPEAARRRHARGGRIRARLYRWPTEPFGVLALFGFDQTAIEDGAEHVYSIDIPAKTVNFGAVVKDPPLKVRASIRALLYANAPLHPWLLGALDENSVQGYGGTPVNMNGYMPDFIFNVGATGAVLPAPGRYYIAVDSGKDPFTGHVLARHYVLHSWINDLKPPVVKVLTTRLAAGRPSIVVRVTDSQSGVDPLSLLLLYKTAQIGAFDFDPVTGIAVFEIPKDEIALDAGPAFMRVVASDFQETKNVSTPGDEAMPNTRFLGARFDVVRRPVVTWLVPVKGSCVPRRAELEVAASSPAAISSVGFYDGKRQVARVRKGEAGIYRAIWRTGGAKRGAHELTAVASDTAGRESRVTRILRVCA